MLVVTYYDSPFPHGKILDFCRIMKNSISLPILAFAGGVLAYDYPPIPKDLTTPSQQRLAIHGPNGERHHVDLQINLLLTLSQRCRSPGTHMLR